MNSPSRPGVHVERRLLVVFLSALLALVAVTGLSCDDPGPFTLSVVPETLSGESIVGQRCVFLVTVIEETGEKGGKPVDLSATASGAEISITPQAIVQGEVAEVTIIPSQAAVGTTLELTFTASRDGLSRERLLNFLVLEGEDDRATYAAELRDRFVSWLSREQPELGLTPETDWLGTMVSPQWLVVSHYLFFSEEWEMHVSWHIMIAPDDWARIDLRRRFTEARPSYGFEISSVSGSTEPHSIEPPDVIWR